MARLVVLSEGFAGTSHELKVDKTTIGRVEDNTFQIPEGSVSSHHCEVFLRGNDIVIKDLDSTNGTFIEGQQVTGEAVLKPGQMLRLGQVELRLETNGEPATSPRPAAAKSAGASGASAATPGTKRLPDHTMVIPQGVKLGEADGGTPAVFGPGTAFEKKTNRGTKVFIAAAIVLGGVIILILVLAALSAGS